MKLSRLSLLALVTIFMTGCHGGHSIDGKWATTVDGTPTQIEFSGGSKMVATGELKNGAMSMTMTMTGTYTLTGDSLKVVFTDISGKVSDASKQALIDKAMESGKAAQLAEMNKEPTSKLVWNSDDEVVMTDPKGKPQTLKRIKS